MHNKTSVQQSVDRHVKRASRIKCVQYSLVLHICQTNNNVYWLGVVCVGFQLYAKNNSDNKAQLWHFIMMRMINAVNKMGALWLALTTGNIEKIRTAVFNICLLIHNQYLCLLHSPLSLPISLYFVCVRCRFIIQTNESSSRWNWNVKGVAQYCLNLIRREEP